MIGVAEARLPECNQVCSIDWHARARARAALYIALRFNFTALTLSSVLTTHCGLKKTDCSIQLVNPSQLMLPVCCFSFCRSIPCCSPILPHDLVSFVVRPVLVRFLVS